MIMGNDLHGHEPLARLLTQRIVVIDGPRGTMIQARKLKEAEFPRRPLPLASPRSEGEQ
jgi:methionine synthase I (cobalamin-dependent)